MSPWVLGEGTTVGRKDVKPPFVDLGAAGAELADQRALPKAPIRLFSTISPDAARAACRARCVGQKVAGKADLHLAIRRLVAAHAPPCERERLWTGHDQERNPPKVHDQIAGHGAVLLPGEELLRTHRCVQSAETRKSAERTTSPPGVRVAACEKTDRGSLALGGTP
jgi:hypothetical protein